MENNRILSRLYGHPWEITQEKFNEILDIAERRSSDLAAVEEAHARIEELESRKGPRLEATYRARNRDGVAVIPIEGPIFRKASWFSEISGATSTETIANDFTTALEDPLISAIAFTIDSPGGEAAGMNELSEMIYRGRGRKPVFAYVEMMAASAAYHIASAAEVIVSSQMGLVGSIGCVLSVPRASKYETERVRKFVSSQSPHKQAGPDSDAGVAQYQAIVDELAAVFIADVARNRGVTPERVAAEFGAGGIFAATKAGSVGMIDRVSHFEDVIGEAREMGRARERARVYGIPEPPLRGSTVNATMEATMSEETKPTFGQMLAGAFGLGGKEKQALRAVLDGEPEASATTVVASENAELAAERKRRIEAERRAVKAEASSALEGFLKAQKITTAQRGHAETIVSALAAYDSEHPAEGDAKSAVEVFKAFLADAVPHNAFGERSSANGKDLDDREEAPTEGDDDIGAKAKAWAQRNLAARAQ